MVCTANQCRSPLIVAALERRLGLADVTFLSAGLLPAGATVTESVRAAAAEVGLDLSDHRSRVLDGRLVRQADLVIGAARAHVREAVVLDPSARSRAFTLRELARRAGNAGPRPLTAPLDEWLDRLAADRVSSQLLGDSPEDDLPDPTGRGAAAHRALVAEVVALVDRLAPLVWPEAAFDRDQRS